MLLNVKGVSHFCLYNREIPEDQGCMVRNLVTNGSAPLPFSYKTGFCLRQDKALAKY